MRLPASLNCHTATPATSAVHRRTCESASALRRYVIALLARGVVRGERAQSRPRVLYGWVVGQRHRFLLAVNIAARPGGVWAASIVGSPSKPA